MATVKQQKAKKRPDGFFSFKMSLETSLMHMDAPEDFVDVYDGKILFHGEYANRRTAGKIRAFVIRVGDGEAAGMPAREVFDHTGELHDYWKVLFDPRSDDFKQSVLKNFEMCFGDVLILDLIEVLPAYRGNGLGLAVASQMIEVLGRGCGLVACKPFPLQFNAGFEHDEKFRDKMKFAELEKNRTTAMRQIRDYWSKLGFRRVGRSYVYALSTALSRPTIQELSEVNLF